jgi:hypothetical protein
MCSAFRLRIFGAICAALILAAATTTAASAAKYTASSYPAIVSGSGALTNTTIFTEGGTIECRDHFEGSLNEASTDLTITPTYTSCRAFGFLNATVSGCKYTFTEPFGSNDLYTAQADITSTCTVVASTCEVKIEPQGPLIGSSFTNETSLGDVNMRVEFLSVAYNVVKDGIGCPFSGTGKKSGAKFVQHLSVTLNSLATFDVG